MISRSTGFGEGQGRMPESESSGGEPAVWVRQFGREDVRELLDLQRLAEGLIPLG